MIDPFEADYRFLSSLPAFFVGGLPRSGTTWVQQLLNAHPELLCLGESRYIDEMVPPLFSALKQYEKIRQNASDNTWAPTVTPPVPKFFGPVFRAAFVALAAQNAGDKDLGRLVAIGEKTPENTEALRRIWQVFPDGRFIHIIRDPRDGAISAYIRFRSRLPKQMTRTQYLEAYCKGWVERIRSARAAADGRDTYMEIRYEDLHADNVAGATRLFSFLGASTDAPMLNDAIEAASFERLSGGRKQGEADATSHYRQGKAGGWRDELSADEVALAKQLAGPLLAEMGYP